jgi:endonuclease YncB( thermonuclease family)
MTFFAAIIIACCAVADDGDSIHSGADYFRIWGIDAPETAQVCNRPNGARWACGQVAGETMRNMIEGQAVTCQPRDKDRYGRTVAVCGTDAIPDLGAEMVRLGLALDYKRYSGAAYAGQERASRRNRRGMWNGSFIEPWDWRKARRRKPKHD